MLQHANCSVMFTLSISQCHLLYDVILLTQSGGGAGINQCSECERPVSHLHQGLLLQQEHIRTGDYRVRACNYVKIEPGRNFPPVLKIVTHTSAA